MVGECEAKGEKPGAHPGFYFVTAILISPVCQNLKIGLVFITKTNGE
jgi:hypothetical protein